MLKKIEEDKKNEKWQKEIAAKRKISALHENLDAIEEAYFDEGKEALTSFHRTINTREKYEDACYKTNRDPVDEILEDYQTLELQKENEQTKREVEALEHERLLREIVEEIIDNSQLSREVMAETIISRYKSLNIKKGDITVRRIKGEWNVRVKPSSYDGEHLALKFKM